MFCLAIESQLRRQRIAFEEELAERFEGEQGRHGKVAEAVVLHVETREMAKKTNLVRQHPQLAKGEAEVRQTRHAQHRRRNARQAVVGRNKPGPKSEVNEKKQRGKKKNARFCDGGVLLFAFQNNGKTSLHVVVVQVCKRERERPSTSEALLRTPFFFCVVFHFVPCPAGGTEARESLTLAVKAQRIGHSDGPAVCVRARDGEKGRKHEKNATHSQTDTSAASQK